MGNKQFAPNTHDLHVIKLKGKPPKTKKCSNCLSYTVLKDTHCNPHKKYSWCQFYGKEVQPKNQGCKKWS